MWKTFKLTQVCLPLDKQNALVIRPESQLNVALQRSKENVDVKFHTFLTSAVESNVMYAPYCRIVQGKDSQGFVGYKNRNGRSFQASNPHQTNRHPVTFLTEPLRRPNFNHTLERCPTDLGTYRIPVEFEVDRAELGQVLLRVRRFSLIHSFIHHRHYSILSTDIVK